MSEHYHILSVEQIERMIDEQINSKKNKFSDLEEASHKLSILAEIKQLLEKSISAEEIWDTAQKIQNTHDDQQWNHKMSFEAFLINKTKS